MCLGSGGIVACEHDVCIKFIVCLMHGLEYSNLTCVTSLGYTPHTECWIHYVVGYRECAEWSIIFFMPLPAKCLEWRLPMMKRSSPLGVLCTDRWEVRYVTSLLYRIIKIQVFAYSTQWVWDVSLAGWNLHNLYVITHRVCKQRERERKREGVSF